MERGIIQRVLLRFRSLVLMSLAKRAANDAPNSVVSFEEVTCVTARYFCDKELLASPGVRCIKPT